MPYMGLEAPKMYPNPCIFSYRVLKRCKDRSRFTCIWKFLTVNRDYSPLMMTNYPHLHFGLLLCLPPQNCLTVTVVVQNSSLVLCQWCLEGISFCHAHIHSVSFCSWIYDCVFSSNANAKLQSFSTFYCHFFRPQVPSFLWPLAIGCGLKPLLQFFLSFYEINILF